MSKITLTDLLNLQSESTAVQSINNNFSIVQAAFDNTFSLDGTGPNQINCTVDMNSNRIINLPVPINATEPLRLGDVGGILPSDIANAATNAAAAAASATAAAASATAAAGYIGAASNAPIWTTAREIILTGDVTGTSPAWNGSANLAFSGTTIASGAVTGAKMASGAAVSNLGFTPLSAAGGTITGDIQLNYTATSLATDSVGFRGIPINEQDAAYTFVVNDGGYCVRHNSGTAHAYTINPMATTAYPIGTTIVIRNVGAGNCTITRGAGVALRKAGSSTSQDVVMAQWGLATMVAEATDTWMITGTGIT